MTCLELEYDEGVGIYLFLYRFNLGERYDDNYELNR